MSQRAQISSRFIQNLWTCSPVMSCKCQNIFTDGSSQEEEEDEEEKVGLLTFTCSPNVSVVFIKKNNYSNENFTICSKQQNKIKMKPISAHHQQFPDSRTSAKQ